MSYPRLSSLRPIVLAGLIYLCLPLAWAQINGSSLLGKPTPEFLSPSQAFKLETRWQDARTLQVHYRLAKGYYLYRERFVFSAEPNTLNVQTDLPRGTQHFDENFNKDVEIYRDELRFSIRFAGAAPPVALSLTSQGCADAGLCYPPQTERIAYLQTTSDNTGEGISERKPGLKDQSQELQDLLGSRSVWLVLPIFFGLGLLLAFTPCVLPMLPILSSIISGRAVVGTRAHPKPWRGLQLAVIYSQGMALVYTALGVSAGLAGQGFAQALQTPLALSLFAALLVLLAVSKFGWYELQLPAWLRNHLHGHLQKQQGGQVLGVLAMGMLSGLMVGPCVTPPLAGILIYIGQTGNPMRGGLALYALACGMSLPLLLLGASAGHWLPKAGIWMNQIKQIFGLTLLGVAAWLIQPLMPTWFWPLAFSLLLLGVAVILRVWQKLPPNAGGKAQFFQWLGLCAALLAALELLGVASGGRDVLQPLRHLQSRAGDPLALPFTRITSLAELDTKLASLPPGKTWAMLDFYADWCVSCKEMERDTFSQIHIQQALQDALWLQVDVTGNTLEDQALLKYFKLFGPPGIIFFQRNGEEVQGARVIGYRDARTFGAHLGQVRAALGQ